MTPSVPDDTRGILDPVGMMQHVEFQRYPPGDALEGLIEWFWSVQWDLPNGFTRDQEVLNHPAGNISIGTIDDSGIPLDPAQGRVYGVMTTRSHRHLSGCGWTVAARTSVGGLGATLDRPASTVTDSQLDLADALAGMDHSDLVDETIGVAANPARVDRLREALVDLMSRRDPAVLAEARQVVSVAALAEGDRSIRRAEDLAAEAGVSVRTLQRLFDLHVGVSPSFVIRRWRIIEAAESARAVLEESGTWRGWAAVAAELGYADQAHLSRDFKAHLGCSPSEYLERSTRPGD